MSPLRYQKWLRLNEVRRPMLNEHYDVTTAAYAVGYESYPISVGNIRGLLVSNICHSPFRKFMLVEWLAAMFLLICGKKE